LARISPYYLFPPKSPFSIHFLPERIINRNHKQLQQFNTLSPDLKILREAFAAPRKLLKINNLNLSPGLERHLQCFGRLLSPLNFKWK
jgi:hypothetical protein